MTAVVGTESRGSASATEVDETIAASVRALMYGRGLKAEQLAEQLHVTRSTMFRKLNGGGGFWATEVKTIADYFGVAVADLYEGLGGRFGPAPAAGGRARQGSNLRPSDYNVAVPAQVEAAAAADVVALPLRTRHEVFMNTSMKTAA